MGVHVCILPCAYGTWVKYVSQPRELHDRTVAWACLDSICRERAVMTLIESLAATSYL